MLKHTSSGGAAAAHAGLSSSNGVLRNNSNVGINHSTNNNNNNSNSNSNNSSTNTTSPTTGTTTTTSTQRNIQLRPPQPLNVSTLSSASLQRNVSASSAATLNSNGHHNVYYAHHYAPQLNASIHSNVSVNGGQRIPTLNGSTAANLLHIPPSATQQHLPMMSARTLTNTTPTTPITPITPNGNAFGTLNVGNNLHTYTNQHMVTPSNNHNNNNNNSMNTSLLTNNIAFHHNPNSNNYSNCQNLTQITPLPAPPLSPAINRRPQMQTRPALLNSTTLTAANNTTVQNLNKSVHGPGPREALTSLGLLCLVSLLLALLSLIFLLKISPTGRDDALIRSPTEDFVVVYDVTLALCTLSLSLNLCCLLVCSIQFLFAVKLLRSPMFNGRDNKYLEKSSVSRVCAMGGFFISIPIFLTGIILYTFNHFHSTPAIITSILIGFGIIFCGCAMVHNVFVWQKEKTISYRSPPIMSISMLSQNLQQQQQQQQQQQTQQQQQAQQHQQQQQAQQQQQQQYQQQKAQQQQQQQQLHRPIAANTTAQRIFPQDQQIGPITPPVQFLNSHTNYNNLNRSFLNSTLNHSSIQPHHQPHNHSFHYNLPHHHHHNPPNHQASTNQHLLQQLQQQHQQQQQMQQHQPQYQPQYHPQFPPQQHQPQYQSHSQYQSQHQNSPLLHPTSVTPVSPNNSQGSFNPLLANAMNNSSFLMRPSTATPPTPKPLLNVTGGSNVPGGGMGREASGSVSPGVSSTLDLNNLTSLHELKGLYTII